MKFINESTGLARSLDIKVQWDLVRTGLPTTVGDQAVKDADLLISEGWTSRSVVRDNQPRATWTKLTSPDGRIEADFRLYPFGNVDALPRTFRLYVSKCIDLGLSGFWDDEYRPAKFGPWEPCEWLPTLRVATAVDVVALNGPHGTRLEYTIPRILRPFGDPNAYRLDFDCGAQ